MDGDLLFSTEGEREEARQAILDLTGLDIAKGHASDGSRNTTYVISESVRPSVIRVSPASVKDAKTIRGELMFVDYLREHLRTVCNPVPFDNSLVNPITVGGKQYFVVVSRKANGISPDGDDFNRERVFELYGAKLGELHVACRTAAEEGFRFLRPDWLDAPGFNFTMDDVCENIPADVMEIMIRIRDKVAELPRTPETFGMIHGDMSPINTFLDWDDVWLFDFDDSCHHYFMYDNACFLIQAQTAAQQAGATFDPVKAFVKGYMSKDQALPMECWSKDYMERFFHLRIASGLWLMQQSRTAKGIASAKAYGPHVTQALRSFEV
ncbi:MAG: phosphotransferase [Atopobiaceae bacterium]|jgi:Ser/Thr protein kinase RdoA (MazF antagonist)|nr:phosphotransferase [Atopobiaceae bacterium]